MINRDDYKLEEKFFYKEKSLKTQVLLRDTHNPGMTHFNEWHNKNSRGYKKTSHFTITKDGSLFEHYSPEYYGTVFGLEEIDKRIITISLENEGWLEYSRKKNGFINWRGDIYHDKDNVSIKQWRGQLFWAPYSDAQFHGLATLLEFLFEEYGIDRKMIDTNVCVDMSENFMGVISKSNYSKFCTDVNPTLNLELLKRKLEI